MISDIFIDRPRLSIVISVVITIAGLIAITQIPVAQFPDIVPPQVQVSGAYPGASASVGTLGATSDPAISRSVSSMRSTNRPPFRRAKSQL